MLPEISDENRASEESRTCGTDAIGLALDAPAKEARVKFAGAAEGPVEPESTSPLPQVGGAAQSKRLEPPMDAKSIDAAVKHVLRMGWIYPSSMLAKAVCPDLVALALAEGWDVERFIREALPRVRAWAMRKLGDKTRFSDLTWQNFIVRMATRRPDLFGDASKGAIEWYLSRVLQKVHFESCREEQFTQYDDFVTEVEDPGQGPLEALAEDREAAKLAHAKERKKVLRKVHGLIKKLPLNQRVGVSQEYWPRNIPALATEVSENAMRVSRSRGLRTVRDKAEAMGMRLFGFRAGRGRIVRSARKPRGRALVRPPKRTSTPPSEGPIKGAATEGQPANREISKKQQAIDARNARALKALIDSLPECLRDRADVLAAVRETFEREFARRIRRRRRPIEDPEEPPSS